MKKPNRIHLALFLLISINAWATDPESKLINTTCGILKNTNMMVEYSVGEIAITTLTGFNCKLTQGFLQPINNLTSAISNENIESKFSFFPNPTQNVLFIVTANEQVKLANIYTMDGRKIAIFEKPETNISLENLSNGMYQVELIDNQNQILTNTKIVKQ